MSRFDRAQFLSTIRAAVAELNQAIELLRELAVEDRRADQHLLSIEMHRVADFFAIISDHIRHHAFDNAASVFRQRLDVDDQEFMMMHAPVAYDLLAEWRRRDQPRADYAPTSGD